MDLDLKIRELFDKVQQDKEEIKKIEKPSWETNSSFSYSPTGSNDRINIQAVSRIDDIIRILSFLLEKESFHTKAITELGLEDNEFLWMGFTLAQWTKDLKTRINKIQINDKKQKLLILEERLNRAISPEMRRQLEVEAIQKEMGL